MMSTLRFTKHHGAGNDFLVLIDPHGSGPLPGALVRALCERRTGIGADGVIRVIAGWAGADVGMVLQNADGLEAEMSGNGIRCLAQAAIEAGLVTPPRFTVDTGAGLQVIDYVEGANSGVAEASVDLGVATLGPDQPQPFGDRRVRTVDVGNPHLVMLGPDPAEVDVPGIGAQVQEVHAGGINVEFVSVGPEVDALTMRVFERGVGETQACGTGSVAAAIAANSWGLVGNQVVVHNPGGDLTVSLEVQPDATVRARLRGPIRRVGEDVIEVDDLGIEA